MVRETPIPDPLVGISNTPSHPDASDEPVLDMSNIQGNSIAGFNKDHQHNLFFRIDDPERARESLKEFTNFVSTAGEVLAFNRLYKSMHFRLRQQADRKLQEPHLAVRWFNIGFTYQGLQRLTQGLDPAVPLNFDDDAFVQGVAARYKLLGDPLDEGSDGNPARWQIKDGPDGPNAGNVAHCIVMVAADRIADAEHGVQFAKKTLKGFVLVGEPIVGTNLPGDQHGHEHFGFLDGVSQPGIRGRISNNKHDVLTVRQNPNNRQQGKPGQELIWPGEFIFGYPGQEGNPDADPEKPFRLPGPVSGGVPDWACDGSYLVFRKLKQDVAKFHKFLNDEATGRKLPSAEFLGSKLVGRWPSGSPAMRTPTTDIPQLGDDDCGNNNFEFQETTDKLPLSSTDRFDCTDQPGYPNATQDRKGLKCPFTAHIRKAYPRDDVTLDQTHPTTKLRGGDFVRTTEKDPEDFSDDPQGTPIKLQEDDTQSHRILRRGIPFGKDILRHDPETPSTPSNPASDDGEDRGLLFFCYQTSIEDQFEFIIRNWVNNRDFKEPFDDAGLPQPRKPNELGGDDPIIGQNNIDDNRERTFTFTIGEGKDATAGQITTQEEWVLPTAGGYFFTPSIHGLHVLAGVAQP